VQQVPFEVYVPCASTFSPLRLGKITSKLPTGKFCAEVFRSFSRSFLPDYVGFSHWAIKATVRALRDSSCSTFPEAEVYQGCKAEASMPYIYVESP
jgi:hypothetical protein